MSTKKSPLISVITTVYNTEKYLDRCFSSVLNQTYENIEFIIVDNASKGNIQTLVKDYVAAYPRREIKIVTLTENKGLYNGRLQGIYAAKGDYIAFIDSDDRVSDDYYRALLNLAIEKNADMTASDVVMEFSDNTMLSECFSPYRIHNIDMRGSEIVDNYWKQEGRCYYWHLVWNKLYARTLIEKALPMLEKQTENVVMSDDMAFSTVFFALAEHFVSTDYVQYFYYKRADAYTAKSEKIEIYQSNLQNIRDVFSFMQLVLNTYGLQEYDGCLLRWKQRYYRIWHKNIETSSLTKIQKKRLIENELRKALGSEGKAEDAKFDDFFYKLNGNYYPYVNEYVKKISQASVSCVSFDIFDTLLMRPLKEPADLFLLMNDYLKEKIGTLMEPNFQTIRSVSESIARENQKKVNNFDEVTLDEIYETMQVTYGFSKEVCDGLKEKEVELELRLIKRRNLGKYLFDLAKEQKKKIVLISDMYLPEAVIKQMLKKCGYEHYEEMFLSSTYRLTKHNGDLFKVALKKCEIKSSAMIHIGDNLHSDIDIPQKIGITCLHTPKVGDVCMTQFDNIFSSTFYWRCFHDASRMMPESATMFLGNRCALAVAVNQMYDNPFRNYRYGTDFNGSIYQIGYNIMGPFLLGLCMWLYKNAEKESYECIHFIARDGYLVKKAFDELQPYLGKKQFKTDYLHISRKALMPLMIQSSSDFENMEIVLNYQKYTPRKVLEFFRDIVSLPSDFATRNIYEGIVLDKLFKTPQEYTAFIRILKDSLFDEKRNAQYREKMRVYFSENIGEHDCFFDVGYSGRSESILKALTGRTIDTYYLNTTTQTGMDNARTNEFQLTAFFANLPLFSGPVRETLMSEQSASCVRFNIDGERVVPQYKNEDELYPKKYMMDLFQEGSVDYIKTFTTTFKDLIQSMSFRVGDLAWPLEYFLKNGLLGDLEAFSAIEFEDDLFLGKTQNIVDYWIASRVPDNVIVNKLPAAYAQKNKFVKFVTLLFYDLGYLKEKVKSRLQGHKVVYTFSSAGYKAARKIYRAIK